MSDVILPIDGDLRPLEAKVAKFASRGINLNLKNSISQPLGRITGQVSEFNKSLEASNARVLAFGASAGAVYAVGKAFSEIIKSTIQVEKQLADINVVLNTSQKSLANFGRSLFDIARSTANPFSEVSKAATEFARQGLGVQETLKRTNDALVLSRLSGLDAAKSVDALTAAVNSFSKAGLNSTQIINKLANVDAGFAVSSADLAEAISRVGSTAQDVGVDIDQLIALVTAAQQTTARGGAVIGNSLKTIFTRLQRSDTLDKLEELGVKVRDLSGETLPAVQVLQNLSKSFNALSQSQKSSVAETVGGVYQINILRAALGDLGKAYSIYGNALDTSRNSTNQATKRNEELNKTVDAQLKSLVNSFTQASTEIGGIVFAPTISKTTNLLNDLLSDLQKPEEARSAGSQIGTEVLKGLGTFVSGPGLAIVGTGFIKIFGGLAKFSAEAFKGFLNIQSGSDRVAAAQERINSILAQNPSLIEAAIQKQNSLASVEQKILQIIEAQNAARLQATQISNKLAPTVIAAENVAVRRSRGKAGGFIPNFAASSEDQMIEDLGAADHGYTAGKAYRTTLHDGKGGSIPAVVNSAERRKDFINSDGKKASLVIPPNGFAKGFVPNFALDREQQRKYLQKFSKRDQIVISKIEAEAAEQNGIKVMYDERSGNDIPFINKNDRSKLTKIFKRSEEGKAQNRSDILMAEKGRAGYSTQKRDYGMYGVVYPSFSTGAPGASTGYSGSKKDRQTFRFKTYPFPGNNFDINEELYENVRKSLINLSSNYFKQLITKPQIVDSNRFKNNIESNLSRSAVEGSLGQIFEAGVKASISSITTDKNANFDLDSSELKSISTRFKLPYTFGNTIYADLKNSLSEGNLNSMAAKISRSEQPANNIKQKRSISAASGYAAGMDEALGSAIRREKMAGVDSDRIKVGKDASLISDQNPLGLGVYNTKDEPAGLRQGISRYGSPNQAKLAGMAKGFIPNFAQDKASGGLGDKILQFSIISSLLASQAKTQAEEAAAREKEKGALSDLTKTTLTASEALEGFSSGAFVGSLFGKTVPGAVAGGLAGAYSGANKINMSQFDGEIKQIKNKVGELNDAANNLDGVATDLAPDFEKLISAMDRGEDISEYKKAIIDKINLDKNLTAQMKTSAMSAFNKDPRSLQPFLTQTSNQMRDEAGIRAISGTLRESNIKNSTPSLADRFIDRVPDNLPFGIKNQLQNVLGSKPEINKNLATQDSATNLMLGSLSGLSMKLDNKKFMDLSKALVDNAKNAEGFVNALISARKSIGDATDDLDELKESLKLDKTGVVGKNIVAGGLSATGQFLNQKAERASGLSKRGPGRPGGFRSNLAGVSQIYNLDYSDPLAMSDEGQADLAKGYLSQSENPLIGGNATLSLRDSLLSQGISEEDIAKQFPEFNKNIDEAIAAKQQQKEGSLRKIFETINKGKPLSKEQEALIKPKNATRKELVAAYRKETAEKITPTTTTKDANGQDVQTPVSRKDLGTTYVPPVMPPAPTAEQIQAQKDAAALKNTSAEVSSVAQENPGVTAPVNQNNGFSLSSLLDNPMVIGGATGLILNGLGRLNPFGRRKNAVAPEISQRTTSPSPTASRFKPGSPLPKGVPVRNVPKPAGSAAGRFLGSAAARMSAFGALDVAGGSGASLGFGGAIGAGFSMLAAGAGGAALGYGISQIPVGNGENVQDKMGAGLFNLAPTLFGGKSKEQQAKEMEYFNNNIAAIKSRDERYGPGGPRRRPSPTTSQRRPLKSPLIDIPLSPFTPSPLPNTSTAGLFQETYASQAFPGVKGLSDQATAFSYGNQFFKSQEDLNKYKDKVKRTDDDPIKQAQEAKREKINQQAPAKEEDKRSYDQEDAKIEKERKKQEEEIKKQAAEAEKATMTPEGSNSNTNNINVAPVITLNAGANQDELMKLVNSKVQEFAQNLMTVIDQKMSDRDKGNVNPPKGMTGNTLTG